MVTTFTRQETCRNTIISRHQISDPSIAACSQPIISCYIKSISIYLLSLLISTTSKINTLNTITRGTKTPSTNTLGTSNSRLSTPNTCTFYKYILSISTLSTNTLSTNTFNTSTSGRTSNFNQRNCYPRQKRQL